MRVGLLHLGQSVDFVVSIFLRSPVLAILAIAWVFLLRKVSLLTSAAADGFDVAVIRSLLLADLTSAKSNLGLAFFSLPEGV